MLLPDNHIESAKDDQLKRVPLARKISELITSYEGDTSYVIGIEGEWGTGKTSFIHLILEQLEQQEITRMMFNPWLFSNQDELISEFFNELSSAFPKDSSNSKIREGFQTYLPKLLKKTEITFSPEVSIGPIKFKAGETKSKSTSDTQSKSYQVIREDLNKSILELDKRILIVIDDIDRLNPEETTLIFRLVKLMADFPNTVFILAYDRLRVEERLDNTDQGFRGSEYLKKIIQVSFTLPNPDPKVLWNIFFDHLNSTVGDIYGATDAIDKKDEQRFGMIFRNGISDLLKTVRDVKRFISSLGLVWSVIVPEDINPTDFIAIESIRVFAPHFYNAMAYNKQLFTTGRLEQLEFRKEEAEKEAKQYYDEMLNQIDDTKVRESVDKICKELFPLMKFEKGFFRESNADYRLKRRVCSEQVFNFYFQLGIPEGVVSTSAVRQVIKSSVSICSVSEVIKNLNDEDRLQSLLWQLQEKIDEFDEESKSNLVEALWKLEPFIDKPSEGIFGFNPRQQVYWFARSVLKSIKRDRRLDSLTQWVNNTMHLEYPSLFIERLSGEIKRGPEPGEELLLDDEELNPLICHVLSQIHKAADLGEIRNSTHLLSLLHRWVKWESKEIVRAYILKLISTTEGLILFLNSCLSHVQSAGGNYDVLRKDWINELVPIVEVDEVVNSIGENEFQDLSIDLQELIRKFKNSDMEDQKRDWSTED